MSFSSTITITGSTNVTNFDIYQCPTSGCTGCVAITGSTGENVSRMKLLTGHTVTVTQGYRYIKLVADTSTCNNSICMEVVGIPAFTLTPTPTTTPLPTSTPTPTPTNTPTVTTTPTPTPTNTPTITTTPTPTATSTPTPTSTPTTGPTSYDCIDGVCTVVEGLGGVYSDLNDCQQNCSPVSNTYYCREDEFSPCLAQVSPCTGNQIVCTEFEQPQ